MTPQEEAQRAIGTLPPGYDKLNKAFWPNPSLNESADIEHGNAVVDKMTIGELAQFYTKVQTGPVYCMVTRRVQELLKNFPPHIEDKAARVAAALDAAKSALLALNSILIQE
jgi:hypothetical protein